MKWITNKLLNEGVAVGATEAQIDLDYPPATYPTKNTLVKNAFRGIAIAGNTSGLQFNSIYRRRITAASYSQIQASFTGKGKIWTTAELVSLENVPSAWWFQLPTDYLWLKIPPEVSTVANQKTEVTYNYKAVAEAWGLMYDSYGAATLLSY